MWQPSSHFCWVTLTFKSTQHCHWFDCIVLVVESVGLYIGSSLTQQLLESWAVGGGGGYRGSGPTFLGHVDVVLQLLVGFLTLIGTKVGPLLDPPPPPGGSRRGSLGGHTHWWGGGGTVVLGLFLVFVNPI